MLLKTGSEKGMLSELDQNEIKKSITDENGEMKGNNKEVGENLNKAYKRMKVEGKRNKEQTAHWTNSSFNGNRPSRDRKRFIPSATKQDYWWQAKSDRSKYRADARSQSSNGRLFRPSSQFRGYFRERSQSVGDPRPRSGSINSTISTGPDGSEKIQTSLDSIMTGLKAVTDRMTEIEKKLETHSVGLADCEEIDVGWNSDNWQSYFTTMTEKNEMIVDNGCPMTLGGAESMDRYMKENGLAPKDLNVTNVNVRFKFGETTLPSRQRVDLPVKMKTIDETGKQGYEETKIMMYRVQGKIPMLLGLNTLVGWKAKIDCLMKRVEIHATSAPQPIVILVPQQLGGHMKVELEQLVKKVPAAGVFLGEPILKQFGQCQGNSLYKFYEKKIGKKSVYNNTSKNKNNF